MVSCTNCGSDAPLRCGGCKDAPSYDDGDELDVSYCGRECQKADWPRHKKVCNNMRRRKSLLRVATLLKATIVSYRDVLYEWNLVKIEPSDEDLFLKLDSDLPRRKFDRFPDHLTSNVEHKEAALLKGLGPIAVCILGPMTRTLLRGLVIDLEITTVKIANPPYPATMEDPGAEFFPLPGCKSLNTDMHMIVLATLTTSHEKWVIDVTGCQFGFKGALFPFAKYVENHCTFMEMPIPYDQTETWDQERQLYRWETSPRNPLITDIRAYIGRELGYRRHFATLVKEHVNSGLIEGSDAEFEVKLTDFSQKVKTHMSSYRSGR